MMMQPNMQNTLALTRDCDAVLIPQGTPIMLRKGTMVTIMQQLGSHFTVQVYANLVRIRGQDADALDRELVSIVSALPDDAPLEDKVWDKLRACFDPEISINIADLGLIYDCRLVPLKDAGTDHQTKCTAFITMTLTAPTCGMGPVLIEDIKYMVGSLNDIAAVEVELVFFPPWDRSRISEAARLQLGLL